MGSANARRRSAWNKSHSFQYRVRLAQGMIHIRNPEGSCFRFETLRPVPRVYRRKWEGNPEAESGNGLSEAFTVSARVAKNTTKYSLVIKSGDSKMLNPHD